MVGGLVSDNAGTIMNSFARGNVVAGANSQAGGLAGANSPVRLLPSNVPDLRHGPEQRRPSRTRSPRHRDGRIGPARSGVHRRECRTCSTTSAGLRRGHGWRQERRGRARRRATVAARSPSERHAVPSGPGHQQHRRRLRRPQCRCDHRRRTRTGVVTGDRATATSAVSSASISARSPRSAHGRAVRSTVDGARRDLPQHRRRPGRRECRHHQRLLHGWRSVRRARQHGRRLGRRQRRCSSA